MARERRPAEELSIEELESLLARKKLEARDERLRQFRRSGRALKLRSEPSLPSHIQEVQTIPGANGDEPDEEIPRERRSAVRSSFNKVLLGIEIVAVIALAFILFNGAGALRTLNQEVADAIGGGVPTPTPLIKAVVLPSGHTPPDSPGGAKPNEAEIPENLRPLVQSLPAVAIPTPGPEQARNIYIPAIWNASAPVVQGDGWEQLKRGVGQHVGSVNPGDVGNLVLSAHNDIFGELFRDLDKLKPGDEILVSTATREYTYRVTGLRIVEPTEVEVMESTNRPTITLISCYPYLKDTQRIVVFGELVGG
ncbi:MAG: class D sortase [Anaerolineaceae bacterium]|nr:MAG: class D sortase [Anaerolineaceae bacterium]